jgi:hypothetical protein
MFVRGYANYLFYLESIRFRAYPKSPLSLRERARVRAELPVVIGF